MRISQVAFVITAVAVAGVVTAACDSGDSAAPPTIETSPTAVARDTASTTVVARPRVTETIYSGLATSRGALELRDAVIARAADDRATVTSLEFHLALTGAGAIDLSGGGEEMRMTYIDDRAVLDDIVYDVDFAAGDDDGVLEPGEVATVKIDLGRIGAELRAGETFTIEVRPPAGSFLVLQRRLPGVLTTVVELD
jgi:archaellin